MVAAVPAVLAGSLLSAGTGEPWPVEAPAEWLMQWTPVPAASFLLIHAPWLAHPAALLGALALLMLLGGLGGASSTLPAHALAGAAAVAIVAVVDVALFGAPIDAALLLLLAVYGLTLIWLSGRREAPTGRREFLQRSLTILGGAAALFALSAAEPLLHAVPSRRLFTYRPPKGLPVSGLSEFVTPVDRFYVMDRVLLYPVPSRSGWRLAIDGEVRRPAALTLDHLLARPASRRYVTMECVDNPVGGPMMGNALWSGVTLAGLLREAGAFGRTIAFTAADGYEESLPRRVLEESGAFVAYGMNGDTLPRAHGYPARLVVPGLYGFKSVKWLTGIRVTAGAVDGTWAVHGWDEMPRIHTTARIDVAERAGDIVTLAGVAFAGMRGISGVEVRANGGPWRRAMLGRRLAVCVWMQWVARVRCAPGSHIEARAIDDDGHIETGETHGAYPNGASGWDAATV